MANGIGTKKQQRGRKKAAKQYAGKSGQASKYVMKKKDATTKIGYAKAPAKSGKYKKQKPTTKAGRKSLKTGRKRKG
jgi:hypothetical protein